MATQTDDLKRVVGAWISFHEALETILTGINAEPVRSNHVHCLSAQDAEQLRKAASTNHRDRTRFRTRRLQTVPSSS